MAFINTSRTLSELDNEILDLMDISVDVLPIYPMKITCLCLKALWYQCRKKYPLKDGYIVYCINMASPKLKKRYFSLTASSYALKIYSLFENEDTSIISVDSGR